MFTSNNKLDWSHNTDALYKKGQSRLHLLRRLRSFGVCRPLLRTFYDTVVASVIFYAVVCWGCGFTERDRKRLNKLVGRAGSVLGCTLEQRRSGRRDDREISRSAGRPGQVDQPTIV